MQGNINNQLIIKLYNYFYPLHPGNNAGALEPAASTNLIVKHDGNVTWLSQAVFKSSCNINVRYFPFDEQLCEMQFASWTYDLSLIDINLNTATGDTTNYLENSEWRLINLTARRNVINYSCCEKPFAEIIYSIRLKRGPLFYMFNMVFMCAILNLMSLLMFLVPPGSGIKVREIIRFRFKQTSLTKNN